MRCWRHLSPANRAKLLLRRETADPRTSDQARSACGWHFSGDTVRFLQGGVGRQARAVGKTKSAKLTPKFNPGVRQMVPYLLNVADSGRRLSGFMEGGERVPPVAGDL